ncbi:MAG: fimbria/pilus outer membrane usher protein [Rhodanobacter sp.]
MRGLKLTLIAIALLASSPLMAQPDRMLLELCINGSCHGTAFVVVHNQHILVDEEALRRALLPLRNVQEETIGSRKFVDLSTYDRGSRIQLDTSGGRLNVTLPASAYDDHQVDLRPRRERLLPSAVPSAFVNYALNVGSGHDNVSAYLDAGYAYGRWLLHSNPSWNPTQGFSRGLSRLEFDDTDHNQRWTIGDQYAYSSDGLGGTALLGGFGVARAYDLDPYLITYPQPTISGLLQAPGTISIYENGVLVGQRQVPAGPFSLASLGLGAGANNVRVVVQDPFGGTSVLQQNYYGANQLLAPGLSEYAYQLGVERTSTLSNSYETGRPVFLARQNYGFSDNVTAGYRVEAESGLVNAGPSVSLRLPFGILTTALAASDAGGTRGHGSSLAYQYNNSFFNIASGVQIYSRGYRRIGDDLLPASFRARRVSYASLGWAPIARVNVQLSAGDTLYADGTHQRNIGLNGSLNLPDAIFTLGINRQLNHPGTSDNQVLLNVVIPFGRSSIGFNATHDANTGNSYGFSAQHSVPTDSGWGYNVNLQNGNDGSFGIGQLDYQGHYGLVQLTGQRFGGQSDGSLLVSGSLVAMDDHVFAGRALQSGYALVQTPGISGVEITRENQPIGATDANGNLLVTTLLPYQANKVGIDQNSVPLDDQIDATDQIVSVPRLGGTIVRFGVHALHAARGALTLNGEIVQYGNATLVSDGSNLKTLVGLDGSFYFSYLPAGNYELQADTASGALRCHFSMPNGTRPIVDLGKIACTRQPGTTP